jgi:hypothetical protein
MADGIERCRVVDADTARFGDRQPTTAKIVGAYDKAGSGGDRASPVSIERTITPVPSSPATIRPSADTVMLSEV